MKREKKRLKNFGIFQEFGIPYFYSFLGIWKFEFLGFFLFIIRLDSFEHSSAWCDSQIFFLFCFFSFFLFFSQFIHFGQQHKPWKMHWLNLPLQIQVCTMMRIILKVSNYGIRWFRSFLSKKRLWLKLNCLQTMCNLIFWSTCPLDISEGWFKGSQSGDLCRGLLKRIWEIFIRLKL